MARNEEKAQSMLSRFRAVQAAEINGPKLRRPFLATECTDLTEAEKWRQQIIREVAKKVSLIQNAGLGEFRIRDLNDEINKLIREKYHWEDRIKELGGPDYRKIGPRMLDHEGREIPGGKGYKYFGAARDLPGVRELFQKELPSAPRKTRGELYRTVDADYYGYRDDDDGVLVPLEAEAEKNARAAAVERWRQQQASGAVPDAEDEADNIYAGGADQPDDDEISEEEKKQMGSYEDGGATRFVAHVPVPSQQDVEQMLLERKRRELLDKYASDELVASEQNSKGLAGGRK
eukprot:Opistho-2@3573